jgi:hypothetical protein
MKRSEAVEEIRKVLAMNGKDDGMGELEEALLHTIEVLGMLPPVHIFHDQHEDYCATYDGDECNCNPVRDNQWEPEDEAK